ncbi:MAG: sigma-54 dependent transcriptional regulator [Neisseria sp.]|nr:sigma-54 dependent transcriptional regulator [Neisseria sp.]
MRSTDILIVDDEVGIRDLLSEILQDEGYGVAVAEDAEAARALRRQTRPAMVLLDIWMPDCDGITLLKEWAKDGLLNMPVVMMSGHASIDTAVEATKIGALDFLEKPIALQKLLGTVERALKYSKMQESSNLTLEKLGNGEAVRELTARLAAAAKSEGPILLTGEAGSPFTLVAEYFRQHNHPWIAPNAEQWLNPAQDWMKAAHNGVLYLGNLAEYDKTVQAAILNTLTRKDRYNVRVVAACSRPLNDLIVHADFDERLGRELSGIVIAVPSLRAHLDDLVHLINQILVQLVESKQVRLVRFTNAALNSLHQYSWPGNFEQLHQVVKNLALSSDNGTVDVGQVTYVLEQYRNRYSNDLGGFDFDMPLRELREEVEKRYFEYHIRLENNNMSQVAQRVGLERTHLYRKLKQLGIHFSKRQEKE